MAFVETAFQPNAFQQDSFQIEPEVNPGGGIAVGYFSRGRWHELKEEERKRLLAKKRREEREEEQRLAHIEIEKQLALEAMRQRRLDEDLNWALRSQAEQRTNAVAAFEAAHRMQQQMYEHSLQDAAAKQAHRKHLEDAEEEADIERLLLE